MGMTQLHARLNSKGDHVVCGTADCGGRMAIVQRLTAEEAQESQTMGDSPMDRIQFLAGWAPDRDGVWSFSEYARRRRAKGLKAKLRRPPQNNGLIPNSVMDSSYQVFPVRAKCEKCGMVNFLTADEIGVPLVLRIPAEPAYA